MRHVLGRTRALARKPTPGHLHSSVPALVYAEDRMPMPDLFIVCVFAPPRLMPPPAAAAAFGVPPTLPPAPPLCGGEMWPCHCR